MGFKTTYLLAYNGLCAAGWCFILVKSIVLLYEGKYSTLYDSIEKPLQIVQTFAIMEILHAVFGIVRSGVSTVFMQVFSRVFVVWAIFYIGACTNHWCTALTIISWSLVEVPRYSFYFANCITDVVPFPLFWLRYSLFYILYPTGITGELLSMYHTLPAVYNNPAYSISLPNKMNISASLGAIIIGTMLIYTSGAPTMLGHMASQRKKSFQDRIDGKKKDK